MTSAVGNGGTPLSIALRLPNIPVTRVENFCASGSEAFRGAVYAVAAGLALVNAYLGLALIPAMWGFWGTVAYRALNEHRTWSTEA